MYYCKDCGQWFEEIETQFLEDRNGEVNDFINICPLCGSVNVEEREKENERD